MKNITARWKKFKTWQKILIIFLFMGFLGAFIPKEDIEEEQKFESNKKTYNYTFIEENIQLTGGCSRTEWVYQVPDDILESDLEPILYEIYADKKSKTDRTNISIYTKTALENINKGEADISVGFLNDGFNCEDDRIMEIKNNYGLYNSMKDL